MNSIVVPLLLLATGVAAAQTPAIRLIAHRGGIVDERYAENGAASLEAAIQRGYWMAEVDVRESKDGKLVVQHDPDFQRFYGVNRKVDEMTWNEIAKLRSTPGNARPLQFHELARLAKNRIQLMIDTKPPEHSAAFYNEMERAMRDNGLLESALFIGTAESRARFKGKARISVTREELLAAMKRGEDCARLYFLFEHGTTLDEAGLSLARKANVPAVVSINIFHYGNGDHRKLARTDIERLRKAGMTYFQIDSVYDAWLLDGK